MNKVARNQGKAVIKVAAVNVLAVKYYYRGSTFYEDGMRFIGPKRCHCTAYNPAHASAKVHR